MDDGDNESWQQPWPSQVREQIFSAVNTSPRLLVGEVEYFRSNFDLKASSVSPRLLVFTLTVQPGNAQSCWEFGLTDVSFPRESVTQLTWSCCLTDLIPETPLWSSLLGLVPSFLWWWAVTRDRLKTRCREALSGQTSPPCLDDDDEETIAVGDHNELDDAEAPADDVDHLDVDVEGLVVTPPDY